jgi:DNA methyltransferase 1-associated protein 1
VLRHWKRKTEDGPHGGPTPDAEPGAGGDRPGEQTKDDQPEDSAFAKFNVQVTVPQYNQDQYEANLQSKDWTKEETDYLLEMAKEYDLRWPIIWDRYEFTPKPPQEDEANGTSTAVVPVSKPRTMEDLKARYYEVAAKMMAVQKPAQYMTRPEFELYEMMQNFNPEQERKRKEFALNTMSRSKDEAREEESLLLEIKRILSRTERFNEERRELYNRLDYPATDSDINSFKSSAGLQALLQNLMSTDKSKKRKSIMGTGEGVSPAPGSAVSENGPGGNRRESIAALASSRDGGESARGGRAPSTPAEATPTSAGGASAAAAAAANKKKGGTAPQQPERRKLSAQEEQVYGVSHHDRLGSGPTFRYEKINKLYSHKSGQQQMRITNALAELDVPARLVMPTAAVTAQFEVLWGAVTALVDLRKVSDKLDAEIKIEEAKKAERDRARGVGAGVGTVNGEKGAGAEAGGETNNSNNNNTESSGPSELERRDSKQGMDGTGSEGLANGGGGSAATAANEGQAGTGGASAGDAAPADTNNKAIKEEESGPAGGSTARPASSGGGPHKRSASVLSAASDKSAKRQKK